MTNCLHLSVDTESDDIEPQVCDQCGAVFVRSSNE